MKPAKTKTLRPITQQIVTHISQGVYDPKIRCIYLFGSEARGEATVASDIDIALL
ncbi:MAG: nucleotidyltransferase domain-containing protein [Defluviitaleaceae bacterium]|nr:nucleotidyltransferase domain-containing protein [Defluviitaleaceae bacterium]MCL2274311.1 nucleotidyltransferase domain-containing protein [Defluviitaleaceae bacterium]